MSNRYKTRAGGATVTIFVPYDCGNNCPFCINKKEYADPTGFSVEKILESIAVMDGITPQCDFVFTGGEPFANLTELQRMLDAIPASHKIYINTTLPLLHGVTRQDLLAFAGKNREKITCINVSRHLVHYVQESDDQLIADMPVPVRVNCVLFQDYPREQLPAYIRRIQALGRPIQFRYDYTDTTPENLYDREHDPIFRDLCRVARYTGLDGCRMRCGFHFDYEGTELTYHKTLPYSTIVETGEDRVTYDILYDILIKQTGELHSDWTGVPLDVEAYRQVVFEPYDLKWLEKVDC